MELTDVVKPSNVRFGVASSELLGETLKARIYGNVAIATALETLTGTSKAYASGPRRFTEVWVKRNGRWQMVGGQTTLVPTK